MNDLDRYLIESLAEECAETIKACMKALRFGPEHRHPNYPTFDNAEEITSEFGEALAIFDTLVKRGVVPGFDMNMIAKQDRCLRWYAMTKGQLGVEHPDEAAHTR